MAKKPETTGASRVLYGVPAAPGVAVSRAHLMADAITTVEEIELSAEQVDDELESFRRALERARAEITDLREATEKDLGETQARIFDVQLQVLNDPLAVDRTNDAIRTEHRNAAFLFRRHMLEMTEQIEGLSDSFFSERAQDLNDVKRRVLRHLLGSGRETPSPIKRGILMGREIAPSDAVQLDTDKVVGFATEAGGPTSHVAIMARARGVPGVVGVKGLMEAVREGDTVAVDGFRGKVEINPGPTSLERMRARKRAFARLQRQHEALAGLPAVTLDQHHVKLSANMEMPAELDYIKRRGAAGVGLFRTEFFFMASRRPPSEEEQYRAYREVVEALGADGAVIRVLDVGGDKMASYMGIVKERNPFLGMRGIRYLIRHEEIFLTQLRAILRAGAHGRARILFPMVSGLDELRYARRLTRKAMDELRREKLEFDDAPELGVMVEVPSLVMMADEVAREADFLSVGSNDLIQYTLAVDRAHEALHGLYQPAHPAVLRSLEITVEAAHRHGKPVSICGEMAGDPLSLPLLLGLGFDRFSVSPYLLPEIKQSIRSLRYEDCRSLATDALNLPSPRDVVDLIITRLGSRFSDLLTLMRNADGGAAEGKHPRTDPESRS